MRCVNRHRLAIWAVALVLAPGCVAEVGPLHLELGRLRAPIEHSFGIVQRGEPLGASLLIENLGPGAVHVVGVQLAPGSETPTHRFEVEPMQQWLRPGEAHELPVRFVPLDDSRDFVSTTLTIISDTDDPDRPGTKQSVQVILTGRSMRYGLEVSPQPVDFGLVPPGTRASVEVRMSNLLDVPLTVYTPDAIDGRAALSGSDGPGAFTIDAYVGPQGDMPRGRALLEPGASLVVPAHLLAPAVSLGGHSAATWRVAGCADEVCTQTVELTGQTENNALICQPQDIDFGQVFPGLRRERSLRCFNRSGTLLNIVEVSMGPGSDRELSVGGPGAPVILPGEFVDMMASFAPTEVTFQRGGESSGTVVVRVQAGDTGLEGAATVRLFGQVGGARLEIHPNPLDFGEVAVRTALSEVITIENIGFETALIQSVEVDTMGTGLFSASTAPFSLPRGASMEYPVTFSPLQAGTFTSGLRFNSNDAVTPVHAVGLIGIGLDIPPCLYELEPAEVQFGAVRLGQQDVREIRVRNTGTGDCLVRDFRIELSPGQTSSAFALADGPAPPTRLTAGQEFRLRLRFAPVEAGNHQAWLTFYVSDPQASNPRIPLYGVGRPLIEVACPGPVTTPAGQPVSLTVQADAVGNIVSYNWAIVNAPTGGIGTPNQWSPAPPTSATESFLAFIVGLYELQATVTDDLGNQASCTTLVTAEGRGLRVTLTWNGPGDIDLHVHRGTSTAWFVDDDCYYANRSPIWNSTFPPSEGPNPELDFDNTTANGPENTRINGVQIGETYTIGAHNFARAQGRRATIQIFCGLGTVPDATLTSRALVGNESSNCSANDFWKVATVVFDSPSTCRVTPLDAYVPSRDACVSY